MHAASPSRMRCGFTRRPALGNRATESWFALSDRVAVRENYFVLLVTRTEPSSTNGASPCRPSSGCFSSTPSMRSKAAEKLSLAEQYSSLGGSEVRHQTDHEL